VVPNFVDTDRYAPGPRRPLEELVGAAALPGPALDRPAVLVHVSNFRPLKRVDDVVRIFAEVHRVRPAVLLLVGDGPERSRVEALARQLGLSQAVVFVGKMLSFVELLRASDVFLMPSESESFGLAALEALSCGVPVVASDVGGIPEVVTDGEVGYLARVGDVPAMADRVLRILADGELRERLSRAARARSLAHFGLQPAIDRYEAHYRRVLASPRRGKQPAD
jgi:N-acetyl-alpha-D-glucosaminyl L-malate synthase BshA